MPVRYACYNRECQSFSNLYGRSEQFYENQIRCPYCREPLVEVVTDSSSEALRQMTAPTPRATAMGGEGRQPSSVVSFSYPLPTQEAHFCFIENPLVIGNEPISHFFDIVFLHDGRLVSGDLNWAIKIWNLATRSPEITLTEDVVGGSCFAVLPDNRLVMGSHNGNAIVIWNLKAESYKKILITRFGEIVSFTCMVPFSDCLACGTSNGTIEIRELETGSCLQRLDGSQVAKVTCLAVLSDNKLVSRYENNTIRIWDLDRGSCVDIFDRQIFENTCLAVLSEPSSKKDFLAMGSVNGDINISKFNLSENGVLRGHTGAITCLAGWPGGQFLVSGSQDNTIRIWDLYSGKCMKILNAQPFGVERIIISKQGCLASLGRGGLPIKIWNRLPEQSKDCIIS